MPLSRLRVPLSGFLFVTVWMAIPSSVWTTEVKWPSFDLKDGQEQFTVLMERTRHPTYGTCWLNVVAMLRADCGQLTAELQSRLAFRFTSCFLETSGMDTYSCSDDELDLNDCIKQMTDRDFNIYTSYFMHTANLCFFLSNQVWNQETEATIRRLLNSFNYVTTSMESTLKFQEEFKANDERYRTEMRSAIETSKTSVVQLFQQIVRLRSSIFGELAGLYTLLFYFFALAFSFLLTSTRRTESARLWLFALFTATIVVEWLMYKWNLEGEFGVDFEGVQEAHHTNTTLVRRASIALAVLVFTYNVYTYCDLNKVNYQLLNETNREVKALSYTLKHYLTQEKSPHMNGITDVRRYSNHRTPMVQAISNGLTTDDYDSSCTEGTFSCSESDVSPVKRTRAATRRKKNSSFYGSPGSCPYNLRDRSHLSSPVVNEVLTIESPEMFSAAVHSLANMSKLNGVRLRSTIMKERLDALGYQH